MSKGQGDKKLSELFYSVIERHSSKSWYPNEASLKTYVRFGPRIEPDIEVKDFVLNKSFLWNAPI